MEQDIREDKGGGLAGLFVGLTGGFDGIRAWWEARVRGERRQLMKRQLFVIESVHLGAKQRVVLLRCGADQFLVGVGPDGVQSITRAGAVPELSELPDDAGRLTGPQRAVWHGIEPENRRGMRDSGTHASDERRA